MAYVQFYTGNPDEFIVDRETDANRNIHSVQILESPSANTGFSVIDTVKFIPTSRYVESTKASDEFLYRFYKLQFIQDPLLNAASNLIVLASGLIYPEMLSSIVDVIREQIYDTDLDNPAFTDDEYVQSIRFALRQWKGHSNLNRIEDQDIPPILLLVQEMLANRLMNDFAKYYALKTPTVQLDKWEIGDHYRTIAQNLRDQFEAYSRRLNMQNGGYDDDMVISQMPSAKMETVRRYSRTAGKYITKKEAYFPMRRPMGPFP